MRRLFTGILTMFLVTASPTTVHATEAADLPLTGTAVNDAVNAVLYHEGTIYLGGDFTVATVNGKRHDRSRLAAVGADGSLLPWAPVVDGSVLALATDGTHLYLSGTFSRVGDTPMKRVARVSLADGTVDPSFDVRIAGSPRALEIAHGRLYLGGDFNTVNGVPRSKLAAVSLSDGSLVEDFTPTFDKGVRDIAADGARLYVGGGFRQVNGGAGRHLVALKESGAVDTTFKPVPKGLVYDIDVDGGRVYTATGGPGGRVHVFTSSGASVWERTADGDIVALTVHDGFVYAGGHFEKVCADDQVGDYGACLGGVSAHRGKLFATTTSGRLTDWNPDADSVIGVITMDSGGDRVVAGGTFLTFADRTVKQRALALFPA